MSRYVNTAALDAALNYIKNNSTKLHLISAYTYGDSYATVVAASIGSINVTSTDFALADQSPATAGRQINFTPASSGTTAGTVPTPDSHIAFVNENTQTVLYVTQETNDDAVTPGLAIPFGTFAIKLNQLSQA